MASIAQGVFVILTLLFLAPLFANLPSAALGAIVITAVVFGLFKIPEMRRLWRLSPTEFWLAMAALLGVLTFGTLQGVFHWRRPVAALVGVAHLTSGDPSAR